MFRALRMVTTFPAFILHVIVSISLPYLTKTDITHVHTNGTIPVTGDPITELRLGIWSYCYTTLDANVVCSNIGHGYSLTVQNSANATIHIGPSWTLGLAAHPVACGFSFLALLVSFLPVVGALISLLAAFLTLIAFLIDIALYAFLKSQMGSLGSGGSTLTGAGFWLNFTAMILLTFAGLNWRS